MHFLSLGVKGLKGWENVLFELRSERVHYLRYCLARVNVGSLSLTQGCKICILICTNPEKMFLFTIFHISHTHTIIIERFVFWSQCRGEIISVESA